MATTKNFGDIIRSKLAADPEMAVGVEHEQFGFDVADTVYNARKSSGITQAEVAARANTSQSVIARIEDADYDGHSLKLLRKIATALDFKLRIEFYRKPEPQPAGVETVASGEFNWTVGDVEWADSEVAVSTVDE